MSWESIDGEHLSKLGDVCAAARDVASSVHDEQDDYGYVLLGPVNALRMALKELDNVQRSMLKRMENGPQA